MLRLLLLFLAVVGLTTASNFAQPVTANHQQKSPLVRQSAAEESPFDADFRHLSWMDSFEALNEKLSRWYAFTDWKRIDWQRRYHEYKWRIQLAQIFNSKQAYYYTMREYAYSIPDGHIIFAGNEQGVDEFFIKGSYGLAVRKLDDNRVIASIVLENGSAANAGMRFGAEILSWNGAPINEALRQTSILWAEEPAAMKTLENLQRERFIGRAHLNSTAVVVFRNRGENTVRRVRLRAVDDNRETLKRTRFLSEEDAAVPVRYEILPSGHGYIKLTALIGDEAEIYRKFAEATTLFTSQNVPGVIVDVRRNVGGSDDLTARLLGFFYNQPAHYEDIAVYNPENNRFEIPDVPEARVRIQPQQPYYGGQVIALTSPGTFSAGEGVAHFIQKLPQGRTLGFHGTHGSFGIVYGHIKLPDDYHFLYPFGQSLDENGAIQVDSDWRKRGGVLPDIRVPVTEENIRKVYLDNRDVELDYAVRVLQGNHN